MYRIRIKKTRLFSRLILLAGLLFTYHGAVFAYDVACVGGHDEGCVLLSVPNGRQYPDLAQAKAEAERRIDIAYTDHATCEWYIRYDWGVNSNVTVGVDGTVARQWGYPLSPYSACLTSPGGEWVVREAKCDPDKVVDLDSTSAAITCVQQTCKDYQKRDSDFGQSNQDGLVGLCLPNPKNNGKSCPTCGDPINPGTGNEYEIETDYTGSGAYPLQLRRYYNSLDPVRGNMGSRWQSSYSQWLYIAPSNTEVTVHRADGKGYTYTFTGTAWASDPDVVETLTELTDGQGTRTGWEYRTTDDTKETYSADGRLLSLVRRDGLMQTLDYEVPLAAGGDDNPLTLDKVTDPAGRTLSFQYDADGRVAAVTDPAGQAYSYSYDVSGNLVSVTYPDATPADNTDNPQRLYHYEDTRFPYALTGITDENGNRFASWGYDNHGRAVFSEHANGAERVDLVYNADGTTTVTDSQGRVRTYHFGVTYGKVDNTQVSGDPCTDCGDYAGTTYDANGFISSRTDFKGNTTTYVHDARGLETSRTEAVGTPQERTITTQWDPVFRLPLQITEPGRITTFSYDAQGRLLERKEEAAP